MATTTTNLGLTKPAGTDAVDIAVINANMDTIDTLAPISGTWTPVLRGSTTAGTGVYDRQIGKYVKQGKLVYIIAEIRVTSLTGGAGFYQIDGLPFTSLSGDNNFISAPNSISGAGNLWSVYNGVVWPRIANGTAAVAYADISSMTYIYLSGVYKIG